MKTKQFRQEWHLLHPFLAGLYPVLHLYAANIEWVPSGTLVWIVALILGATALLLWLLKFVIPRPGGRALVVTLFYVNFYLVSPYAITAASSHVPILSVDLLPSLPITSALYLSILLVVTILFARRSGWGFQSASIGLNVFAGVLLLFSVSEMLHWYGTNGQDQGLEIVQAQTIDEKKAVAQKPWYSAAEAFVEDNLDRDLIPPEVKPDIYYIIFDGYGRADVLEEYYQFRDQEFLDYLTSRGFYIAQNNHSNYAQTYFSLASSLNLNYLDPIQAVMGTQTRERAPLRYLIENNAVVRSLKSMGYKYVLLSSDYHATETSPLADRCYCDNLNLREFEQAMIARTTMGFWVPRPDRTKYDEHRDKILSTFYYLQHLPELDAPKFVFAHFIAPHPPFVFDQNGNKLTPNKPFGFEDGNHFLGTDEEYIEGYRSQVAYTNRQIQKSIDRILARSKVPPIIILQGDHGPGSRLDWRSVQRTDLRERMSIFNAYYFPNGGSAKLYDTITPVNTFRILFNHYFGAHYEVMEDKSYFALWTRPYDFIEVTLNQLEALSRE